MSRAPHTTKKVAFLDLKVRIPVAIDEADVFGISKRIDELAGDMAAYVIQGEVKVATGKEKDLPRGDIKDLGVVSVSLSEVAARTATKGEKLLLLDLPDLWLREPIATCPDAPDSEGLWVTGQGKPVVLAADVGKAKELAQRGYGLFTEFPVQNLPAHITGPWRKLADLADLETA